ncbi:hypothetical protein C7271_00850 [filamentous cyanobacterium CCP5]|nr:hypothetical protein C7271_00850 [filamentous cyanobacterium CCP5]
MAVNMSPSSGQAAQAESEVLAKQLEFVLKMNSAFLGFLGIIGALLTWFFKNNLEDAKKVASQMVREGLDQHIQERVQEEFRYWEMSARTERVVGQTLVNYYLPDGIEEPREFFLVKQRGFRPPIFCSRLEEVRRASDDVDVVILDVQNWKDPAGHRVVQLTDRGWLVPESEALVKEQIDLLRSMLSDAVVLVVYVRGIVAYLNDAKFERFYVLPANNQVTLLGHAVNGAYVAYADRIASQRS